MNDAEKVLQERLESSYSVLKDGGVTVAQIGLVKSMVDMAYSAGRLSAYGDVVKKAKEAIHD